MCYNFKSAITQTRECITEGVSQPTLIRLGVAVNNKLLWKEQCDKLVCKGNSQL